MASTKTLLLFTLVSLVIMAVHGGSPPSSAIKRSSDYTSIERIWKDNVQNKKNPTNIPLEHQTRSDAMQLYSINAKQIVKVKDTREKAWARPNYELTMTPSSRSRRDNKFFTETASYQRLKIRSADNQKYLCARTNGDIVFKESADKEERITSSSFTDGSRAYSANKADKKNKPRKRCLFHWEFTNKMHIQLSLEAGNKKRYFLSVKDNIIKLRLMEETTELERSFLWLPTKPLKGQSASRQADFNNQRSRKFNSQLDRLFGTGISEKVIQEKDQQIEMLLAEVKRLNGKINEIKDEKSSADKPLMA